MDKIMGWQTEYRSENGYGKWHVNCFEIGSRFGKFVGIYLVSVIANF